MIQYFFLLVKIILQKLPNPGLGFGSASILVPAPPPPLATPGSPGLVTTPEADNAAIAFPPPPLGLPRGLLAEDEEEEPYELLLAADCLP